MRPQPAELQYSGLSKEETQATAAAAATIPFIVIQSGSSRCSIDADSLDDFMISMLNDDECHAPFIKNHRLLVADEECDDIGLLVASTPDTRSTHSEEDKHSTKINPSPLYSQFAAQDQDPILFLHALVDPPTTTCCPDDTVFDPIRILRGVRGAPPPPPRRFYAFWWRDVARAAYGAERAARLRRARAGGGA
jgi:hypothetical protein